MGSFTKFCSRLAIKFRPRIIPSGEDFMVVRGQAEGTAYNITYLDRKYRDFSEEIKILLIDFEKSLSVYDPDSIISRVNRNEDIAVDNFFISVFEKAKKINNQTGGAFDMSAEPLFRVWGFSSEGKKMVTESDVSQLKKSIGMDKIRLKGRKVEKQNPYLILNANAIAKGYSSDIISAFLDSKGISNYLVEIGGEIRVKGLNPDAELWQIGIDSPIDGDTMPGDDVQAILRITDKGIATSGNYRQFYIAENGEKVSHTIDPRSGYPTKHNLLSVTVVAKDTIAADAFATAFLVMGLEEALQCVKKFPALDALFIYSEDGKYKVSYTSGMDKYIVSLK